jgi:hypothetical protein
MSRESPSGRSTRAGSLVCVARMRQRSSEPLVLDYPFRGRWRARNSPARRVPSHGTHLMGTTYAIDFIPVDESGRPGPRSWRAVFGTEAPEGFYGFGSAILAPMDGTVVSVHDGEPDHEARRSQLTLLAYMVTQARRIRGGPPAIAGNHVVVGQTVQGPFVLVAHLRRGSVAVHVGDRVERGEVIGACGNSGNSTQPHVHIQATDTTQWDRARGLPIAFRNAGQREPTIPGESEVVTA